MLTNLWVGVQFENTFGFARVLLDGFTFTVGPTELVFPVGRFRNSETGYTIQSDFQLESMKACVFVFLWPGSWS
jgi:hypothetical protein